jgi:hypothetical protein
MQREKATLFPLLVFLCTLLPMWYRAPERIEHGFLWAEDATIFIAQAHELGIRSFVQGYSGYLVAIAIGAGPPWSWCDRRIARPSFHPKCW